MNSAGAGGHGGRAEGSTASSGGATPDGAGGATITPPPPPTTAIGGQAGLAGSGSGGQAGASPAPTPAPTATATGGQPGLAGSGSGGQAGASPAPTPAPITTATGGQPGLAGSGSGGQAGASPAPTPSLPATTGTLVPLYTYPTHASWRTVIDAKLANPTVPVVAVINPASGPGAKQNTDYLNGIAALRKAGVGVLGYVSTAYTKRLESAVYADIDAYRAWYPETTGIFFDEQSNNAGGEDYYRRVDAYARSKAFTFTVGNPGADTAPSYVGTVDLILVYESSGLPATAVGAGWHAAYDRRNFGIIPYGVPALDPTFIAQAKANVGYLYITGDTLPNPWDSVPPYFGELLAQLAL